MSNLTPSRNDLITQVQRSKFSITKFRDGYDLEDVDEFLDHLVLKLQQDASRPELLQLLGSAQFRVTKFRDGYLAEQVDSFLENLQSALSEETETLR